MRARIMFSILLALVLTPGFVSAQQATPQQQRLENAMRQAPQQDPVQAPRQRQMTPSERVAMQQAQRGNPLAANQQQRSPEGFPLPPEQEKYISDLLDYWQQSSQQVKRSTCEFTRREYDPEYCNFRDPRNKHLVPFNISLGKINFSSPDKGHYETFEVWDFEAPPAKAGEEPKYKQREIETNKEKWLCDGRAIYQYDYANKRLNESKIPPELQGNGLVNSPLPFFIFGADKEQLMNRYWIRPATPEGVTDAYWLEAFPKRQSDGRVYKKLDIIISRDDFLPASLVMYDSNYDALKNPSYRSFEFTNRKVNSQLGGLKDAVQAIFRRPPTPIGWKRVEIKPNSPVVENVLEEGGPRPAQLPGDTKRR